MKYFNTDMDGTLYRFDNETYTGSSLEKNVEQNVLLLLQRLGEKDLNGKFNQIKEQFGENFSIAFEQLYGIPKNVYFDFAWNINPEGHLFHYQDTKKILSAVRKQYEIILISDAPKIWIERVVNFLDIRDDLSLMLSGDGDKRKGNGLLYQDLPSKEGFMIGDIEKSDIANAKTYGLTTIFINSDGKKSELADHSIRDLKEVLDIVL